MPASRFDAYRNLLLAMTIGDLKLRYHGSALGILWSFIRPLLMFLVLYLVFGILLHLQSPHYILSLLLGLSLWNFFSEATTLSLSSTSQKLLLIRKIAFPKSVIVASAVLISFFNLLVSLCIFGVFFAFSTATLTLSAAAFPLPIIFILLFTFGVSFGLSALYPLFRDIRFMWEVLLQMLFWATPIAYTMASIPVRFHEWLFLNPLTAAIESLRSVFLMNVLPAASTSALLAGMSLVVFFAGYFLFKWREPYLPEDA